MKDTISKPIMHNCHSSIEEDLVPFCMTQRLCCIIVNVLMGYVCLAKMIWYREGLNTYILHKKSHLNISRKVILSCVFETLDKSRG